MFDDARQRAQQLLSDNATTILTAVGVVGTVATAVLSGKAAYKAMEVIIEESYKPVEGSDKVQIIPLTKFDKAKLVWPYFVPPVITGSATIASIIMANRMSAQKAAALAAAYGLSEKQFREYKEKVTEKLTPGKEQKIKDELAQDRVNNTPGSSQVIVVEGEVLCFDEPTGRYFRSSMDAIHRAANRTNEEILRRNYASASYFYEQLGLKPTTWTDEVGWNVNNIVDLQITTVLSDDQFQRPCIAINFRYLPIIDYITQY